MSAWLGPAATDLVVRLIDAGVIVDDGAPFIQFILMVLGLS